jgi:two-component system, NtrC family, response regulator PilR
VRELENLLHRAVALSEGQQLHLDMAGKPLQATAVPELPAASSAPVKPVPLPTPSSSALALDLQGHLDQQERDILVQTLTATGFNRTAAAARLGLSLRQIRYRMARLNIDVPQGGDSP